MGHIAEQYFEDTECLKCKGKKFKAIVTTELIYYQDGGECWEDEMNSNYINNVKVFCCDCGKQLN